MWTVDDLLSEVLWEERVVFWAEPPYHPSLRPNHDGVVGVESRVGTTSSLRQTIQETLNTTTTITNT